MDISVRYLDSDGTEQHGQVTDLDLTVDEVEYHFDQTYGPDCVLLEVIDRQYGYVTVAGIIYENDLEA